MLQHLAAKMGIEKEGTNFSSTRVLRPEELVEPSTLYLVVTNGEKIGIFTNSSQFDMSNILLMAPEYGARQFLDWKSAHAYYTEKFEDREVSIRSRPPVVTVATPSSTLVPTKSLSASKPKARSRPKPREALSDSDVEIVFQTEGLGTKASPYAIEWDIGRLRPLSSPGIKGRNSSLSQTATVLSARARKRGVQHLGHTTSSAATRIRLNSKGKAKAINKGRSSKSSDEGDSSEDSPEDQKRNNNARPGASVSGSDKDSISKALVVFVPPISAPTAPLASTSSNIGVAKVAPSRRLKWEKEPEWVKDSARTLAYLESLNVDPAISSTQFQ